MVNTLENLNSPRYKISKFDYEIFCKEYIFEHIRGVKFGKAFCKKFNISEEEIKELNPLLRTGLKEGQLLILGEKINKNTHSGFEHVTVPFQKCIFTFELTYLIKTSCYSRDTLPFHPFRIERAARRRRKRRVSPSTAVLFFVVSRFRTGVRGHLDT
jgi:hypothetical protein